MQLGIVSSPGQMHLGHLSVHEYFSCLMQLSHVFHVLVQRINFIFNHYIGSFVSKSVVCIKNGLQ